MKHPPLLGVLLGILALACGGTRASGHGVATAPAAPVTAPGGPTAPLPAASCVLTTPATPFARSTIPAESAGGGADVTVDEARPAQVIDAFGGAFNEQGWDALSVLDETTRAAALRLLFDAREGLALDWCRTPIGASDYAMSRYTLNETPGDIEMAHFSVARDEERLIPFIRAALAVRPDLKLWGSAWTPPTWMKTNRDFDGGAMRDEPAIYAAYARYLLKFVEAYRARGIDVTMVVPQNEPGQLTHYPSADWRPAQYVTFLRDHLGPLLRARSPATRIFVGTINRADWDVASVLGDPGVSPFVSGVALQWGGLAHLPRIRAAFPALYVMQSETECGNHHWEPGFDPERPPNDFSYAAHTWRKIRDYLGGGASSYMLWNLVLDEQGKNLDSRRPWPQNAALVVDRATRELRITPMYWATRHYSALVERGARLVATEGGYPDRIAFVNPDGDLVVELMNAAERPVALTVAARGRTHRVTLPSRSFASLLLSPG